MKFGDNLENSIYPPWHDNYVRYNVLKKQLEEGLNKPTGWTERDEGIFGQTLDTDLTTVRTTRTRSLFGYSDGVVLILYVYHVRTGVQLCQLQV
jgi:SPX domain protein involved in polyphosphate accumulation